MKWKAGENTIMRTITLGSLIGEQIGSISSGIIIRSLIQTILTTIALMCIFGFVIRQTRRANKIALEKETFEAKSRIKQQELERRLALQEQLLEQEQRSSRLEWMITALSSDYKSVYYLDLDRDEGECYQAYESLGDGFKAGDTFPYMASVTDYANRYITESYREDFLKFVRPDSVREGLEKDRVISCRYMICQNGQESYEMVKFAGVRHPEELEDRKVHAVAPALRTWTARPARPWRRAKPSPMPWRRRRMPTGPRRLSSPA